MGAFAFLVTRRVAMKGQPPVRIPFTAVMVERTQRQGEKEPFKIENFTYALRHDGSWVTARHRQIFPDGGWGDIRVVVDLSFRRRVVVDPSTESVVTYPIPLNYVEGPPNPPEGCTTGVNPQRGNWLKYETVRIPEPPQGEVLSREAWFAPSLGCVALRRVTTVRLPGSDETVYVVTMEALWVVEGEPDSALFDIPANYVERSPSELSAEHARRFNGQRVFSNPREFDKVYQSFQNAPNSK
jgi:hypothetical protein